MARRKPQPSLFAAPTESQRERLRALGWTSRDQGAGLEWQPPGEGCWLVEAEAFGRLEREDCP